MAFGANLLGAMVGGVLEYTSLILGYRWLLVLIAALYGLAFGVSALRGYRLSPYADSGSPSAARAAP